jgi:arsenate reductase
LIYEETKLTKYMKKIYHLATCSTCQRILKEIKPDKNFILQDIKTEKITVEQIEEMKKLAGSYEALFSRVALKFRSMGLNQMQLNEKDYKKYILEEYTFLRRPVVILENEIFIGNAKSVTEAIKKSLKNKKP